jgi:hypothetical protein
MEEKKSQRKGILRESLTVILVLALFAPVLEAKERRGARLVVTKKDGTVVQGELLVVKGEDLILMDGSTSEGITESLQEIQTIKVIKKSKLLKGLGIGFLVGAVPGALVGASKGQENPGLLEFTPGGGAVAGAIVFGTLGALIGGVVGVIAGIDQNITIKNTSSQETTRVGGLLRRLARDRS